MSTKKIEEALRQLYREGDRSLRDAALKELKNLRRAARTWQDDLDADKRSAHEMHDLFTAIAEEEPIL